MLLGPAFDFYWFFWMVTNSHGEVQLLLFLFTGLRDWDRLVFGLFVSINNAYTKPAVD